MEQSAAVSCGNKAIGENKEIQNKEIELADQMDFGVKNMPLERDLSGFNGIIDLNLLFCKRCTVL